NLMSRSGSPIRGGMYWGLPSKEVLDIAGWVDLAVARGYKKVVLVGHSAGGPAVRRYQSEKQDPRVVGIVLASVAVGAPPSKSNPERDRIAAQMVSEGRGQEFLPNLRISAATYVDYGRLTEPDISRIACPILAWFGSNEAGIGTADDLKRMREQITGLAKG